MTPYEIMIEANLRVIQGEEIPPDEQHRMAKEMLVGRSDQQTVKRFHYGVRAPRAKEGDPLYPFFFIPPYRDGKKLRTLTGVLPGTHILSANGYELEILRLLHLFSPQDQGVKEMVSKTVDRLRASCFGQFCAAGECFDSSIVALRFLGTIRPEDLQWLSRLLEEISKHMGDKKRQVGVRLYYWLCLSELPLSLARPGLEQEAPDLIKTIQKGSKPTGVAIARNCLTRIALL